jgi:predicted dehydrogenase
LSEGVSRGYDSYGDWLTLRFGDITIPRLEMTEPLKLECQQFLECVRTGKTPVTDGEDGLRVLRVLDAAQRSLEQGGAPVELAPAEVSRG